MDCWSPMAAKKAYMHTVKLCKEYHNNDSTANGPKLVEPKCIEFLSALAAGNRARLMVDATSDINHGMSTSTTLALAIAAKSLGGHVICIRREREVIQVIRAMVEYYELGDVIELKVGDPCEVIKQCKNIDFVVVDHRMKECLEFLFTMDLNPNGSVVVVSNLFQYGMRRRVVQNTPFAQMMMTCNRGLNKTAILPIGGGMEITRILGGDGRRGVWKSCKRSFMVYDEYCPKFHEEKAKEVGIIISS